MDKVSKRTGNRRLMKLIALLEADAKNKKGIKFDLTVVAKPSDWSSRFDLDKPVSLDCGTTACAMGLAAISGAFKRQGLSAGYDIGLSLNDNRIWPKWNGCIIDYHEAAMELFGIDRWQAHYLFSPTEYPSNTRTGADAERLVVKRIKEVVAGKQ